MFETFLKAYRFGNLKTGTKIHVVVNGFPGMQFVGVVKQWSKEKAQTCICEGYVLTLPSYLELPMPTSEFELSKEKLEFEEVELKILKPKAYFKLLEQCVSRLGLVKYAVVNPFSNPEKSPIKEPLRIDGFTGGENVSDFKYATTGLISGEKRSFSNPRDLVPITCTEALQLKQDILMDREMPNDNFRS